MRFTIAAAAAFVGAASASYNYTVIPTYSEIPCEGPTTIEYTYGPTTSTIVVTEPTTVTIPCDVTSVYTPVYSTPVYTPPTYPSSPVYTPPVYSTGAPIPYPSSNGTVPSYSASAPAGTSTAPPEFTGAANAVNVPAAIAGVAGLFAYFL